MFGHRMIHCKTKYIMWRNVFQMIVCVVFCARYGAETARTLCFDIGTCSCSRRTRFQSDIQNVWVQTQCGIIHMVWEEVRSGHFISRRQLDTSPYARYLLSTFDRNNEWKF